VSVAVPSDTSPSDATELMLLLNDRYYIAVYKVVKAAFVVFIIY